MAKVLISARIPAELEAELLDHVGEGRAFATKSEAVAHFLLAGLRRERDADELEQIVRRAIREELAHARPAGVAAEDHPKRRAMIERLRR